MSFSKELDDKIQSLIVSHFAAAQQVSLRESLELQISWLQNAGDRQACRAHLTYAEEHVVLADRRYAHGEDGYIKKHLTPSNDHMPRPKWASPSYVARVDELRAAYRASPEGQTAAQERDQRKADLWIRALERVETARAAEVERGADRQTRGQDRDPTLSKSFVRARDR